MIGNRIKEARIAKGLTQLELSQKLGYKNISTISKIESGINDIPQSKVVQFADALGVSISYLMGWEASETEKKTADAMVRMTADQKFASLVNLIASAEPDQLAQIENYVRFILSQ